MNSMCNHSIGWQKAVVLFLILTATSASAEFSLEQILSSPFPTQLVTARNSSRIAWVFNSRGVSNVWIADGPGFAARQVTHYTEEGVPIAALALTPDGSTAVYALGTEATEAGDVANPNSRTKAPKQQVYAVNVAGGEPRLLGEMGCTEEGCEDIRISPDGQSALWAARKQIWIAPVSGASPAKPLAYVRGNNTSPRWSPDGRQVALVSNREDHSFIVVYDLAEDTLRYISPSADRDSLPRWSPDGKQIAFVRRPGVQEKLPLIPIRPEPWGIWVADAANGEAKEIWHSGKELNDSFPELTAEVSFHFAGGRIIFASEQDGRNHLYSISPSGGAAVALTPGQFDVEDVRLSADGKSILYSSNQDDVDRRHLWRVPVEGGKPQALTQGESMEWSPVETGQGGYILCLGSTATTPAMPYRVTGKGREMIAASALPSDFPSAQLVTPKQVIFKSEDGLEIHGQLFVPPGRTQPGPALIFTHGGPIRQMMLGFHYMDYYHNAYAMNQYLASRGYVVLSVNYRLGIMYGRAFREPADGGWRGSSEYKDVIAGARYLQSLPTVDPRKIGLWGGSYGGLLTALGLARNSDIFAAGVDFHGVHDWSVFLPRWINRPTAPDAAEANKLAFQSSPNASVDKWKSPVLLIHGDDDRNVPFSQTTDLAQRLREHKVPFEELIIPDEIHGFLRWHTWLRAYGATGEFFDRVLKRGQMPAVRP